MAATDRDGVRLARFEAAAGPVVTGLALAVIPVYVAQALADDASAWVTMPLAIARIGIQVAMGADVAIRTYLAPRRAAFLATHKLDLLAIAVPPIRAAKEVVGLRSILQRPGVARFTAITATVIVACALVVYAAEHDRDDASITSLGDAFWWAVVTTTTVGYGDQVPITDQGRFMAAVLMGFGLALLAVFTAHIAAHFVDHDRSENTELLARLSRLELTLDAIDTQLRHLTTTETDPDQRPAPPQEDR